jgi:hypothetical protein
MTGVSLLAIMLAVVLGMTDSLPSVGLIAGIVLAGALAVVFVALFQGPPPATIAQVLYDTEQRAPTGDHRRVPSRTDGIR